MTDGTRCDGCGTFAPDGSSRVASTFSLSWTTDETDPAGFPKSKRPDGHLCGECAERVHELIEEFAENAGGDR